MVLSVFYFAIESVRLGSSDGFLFSVLGVFVQEVMDGSGTLAGSASFLVFGFIFDGVSAA